MGIKGDVVVRIIIVEIVVASIIFVIVLIVTFLILNGTIVIIHQIRDITRLYGVVIIVAIKVICGILLTCSKKTPLLVTTIPHLIISTQVLEGGEGKSAINSMIWVELMWE